MLWGREPGTTYWCETIEGLGIPVAQWNPQPSRYANQPAEDPLLAVVVLVRAYKRL
jgi:hypothetical protein